MKYDISLVHDTAHTFYEFIPSYFTYILVVYDDIRLVNNEISYLFKMSLKKQVKLQKLRRKKNMVIYNNHELIK